jgi:hypothetical protein
MKPLFTAVAVSGLMLLGAQAIADTSTGTMTMAQKHQAMKDCVTRETSDNSGMSKADAKKSCRSKMKAQAEQSDNTAKYDNQNDANNPSNGKSSTSGMGNDMGTMHNTTP